MQGKELLDELELSDKKAELLQLLLAEEGLDLDDLDGVEEIRRADRSGALPLSFAQQRLWFLDQLQPGSSAYNLPAAVRLAGALDAGVLGRTLDEVVRRHESLRTVFNIVDGRPVQVIMPHAPTRLEVVDLSGAAEGERERATRRLAAEEAQTPFDLSRGPLLRTKLLRLAAEEHVLLFTTHHTVSDGWSNGVLVREVAAVYEAFSQGRPSPLPELPIQYADFAVWQREWLTGEVLETQLGYWRRQLEAAPPSLELPADRPHRAVRSFAGATHTVMVPAGLGRALQELSRERGATLFMTLLAAFQTLLHRYTSQDDISVGTPVAGRTRVETEPLIGNFVNTLVLRSRLSGRMSFGTLLESVRETALEAYAHQDVPFERLVEEFQVARDLSHTPLFQVLFVLQNMPEEALELPGLRLSEVMAETGTAKFDLTLRIEEAEGALRANFEYSTDIFDPATVERLAAHFLNLLQAVAADPEQRLSDLPLLDEGEREQILRGWNSTAADYPSGRLLHQWFEEQAAATPERTALVFEGGSLTYAELNARANRLAHYLRGRGVGPESLVGVLMERSAEMLVALYAILKAGGAYVPLDPEYPRDRLAFMLGDAAPRVLITQRRLADSIPAHDAEVLCLDDEWALVASQPADNPPILVEDIGAAYMIYTSGSTGRPKGVVNTHRGICNRLVWMQEAYGLTPADRVMQKTPFSFDVSVWEFFWPLMYGACLVVARPRGHQDSAYLAELVRAERITTMHFVPSMLQAFVEEEGLEESCASLRRVICSGEALPFELQERFFARLSAAELHNLYGPTEAAVDVTFWECERAATRRVVPIGRPIANTQIYILDPEMRPVPAGVAGELHIGGTNVSRGYLNRPALTAEKFVPNPFSEEPGARLYRTGDLARHLAGGEIEYLGRIDHQVKVRGFRIELGEIEAALARHASVKEAVVVAREDAPGGKRLVAYLVAETQGAPTLSELRAHLKELLPEYMVPSAFVTLERMPLSPNGKVDRKALPAPDASKLTAGTEYVAPRGPVEETLAAVWAQVLRLDRVGTRDDFFALGGDSILSIRAASLARERGVEFSVQQLFQHQTVAALAAAVVAEGGGTRREGSKPFDLVSEEDRARLPEEVEDAYPLTAMQAGMLYHMELLPDAPVYHNVNGFEINAPFDADAFQRAVDRAVARHAVLRTSFDLSGYSQPLQLVRRDARLHVGVFDLRGLSPEERAAEMQAFELSEKNHRFDISRAPLLRFHVHLLEADTYQFTLTECHAILDGWSLHTTLNEIFTTYERLAAGEEPAKEPDYPVAFRDFVELEQQAVNSEECRRFWDAQLGDADMVRLPRWPAEHRPARESRIFQQLFVLPPDVFDGLKRLAASAAVPLKTVLLAAHNNVMHMLSGTDTLLTGYSSNGRPEDAGGDQIRGLFLNILPFRSRREPGTWEQVVRRTFEAEREMLPHRRYPLAAIQKGRGQEALFETLFNFVHFHAAAEIMRSAKTEVRGMSHRVEETSYTLLATFQINPLATQLVLQLDCDATELAEEQCRAALGYYAETLRTMARDPRARAEGCDYLSAAERAKIVRDWNRTATDYPRERSVTEIFERQAAATPDGTAVVFEGASLTYGELNGRANQLAHHLLSLGVRADELVALSAERTPAMIVALLGILKAGAAYAPLDPSYPRERQEFMLRDTGARVLLTEERLRDSLPAAEGLQVVCLDTDWPEIATRPAANPNARVSSDGAAYVMYTSGSTGQPKGIVITHRAINRLVINSDYVRLDSSDRVVQASNSSFDASTFEIWGALLSSARLVMLTRDVALSPREFAAQIREQGVTTLFLTTALFNKLAGETPEAFARLRHLLFGGEHVDPTWVRRVLADGAPERLLHVYGPTESTTYASWHLVERVAETAVTVPIGRPLANTQLYVLDPWMRPVPVGAAGELYVGGDGLARGYLNRPALTAEKFVPSPFSEEPGARLYRTGDLVRFLPEGAVEFIGRIDQQVKIRGFRIEPGEVESVLARHPEVSENVVMVRQDAPGEKRLVAYVVGRPGAAEPLTVSGLRSFLKEHLPEYMVPSAFVTLDALPLNANGKVDKKALPAPDESRPELEEGYVAPSGRVEEELCRIWSEVLGLERVGVEDNFFELGGDSILSIQIIARAQQAGIRLTPRQLFQAQTVSGLALVAEVAATEGADEGDETGEAPLTPIQRWFFEEVTEDRNYFNQSALLALREPLGAETIERALREIVARHGALRARFQSGAATYGAGVEESLRFTSEDVRGLEGEALSEEIERRAERTQGELNIETGPLVRAALYETDAGEPRRLSLVVHHLAVDGVSWRVLLEDFEAACRQLAAGRAVELPARTTSFGRWASRLAEWARTGEATSELEYWLEQHEALAGAGGLTVGNPAGSNTQADAEAVTRELNEEETRALLTEVPAAYRTQIQEVLLAALARTLGGWAGGERVAVALEGHGREELFAGADISRTVGWFTSVFPVALDTDAGLDRVEALKRVKERLRSVPRKGAGYGVLRYMNEETAALLGGHECALSFNYLGQFDQTVGGGASLFEGARESAGPSQSPRQQRPHELEVGGMVAGGRLRMSFTYSRERMSRAEVERVAGLYLGELRGFVERCRAEQESAFTPSDFPEAALAQKDLDKLLAKFNRAGGGE